MAGQLTINPKLRDETTASLFKVRHARQAEKTKEADLIKTRKAVEEQLRGLGAPKNGKRTPKYTELASQYWEAIAGIDSARSMIKFLADQLEEGMECLEKGSVFMPKFELPKETEEGDEDDDDPNQMRLGGGDDDEDDDDGEPQDRPVGEKAPPRLGEDGPRPTGIVTVADGKPPRDDVWKFNGTLSITTHRVASALGEEGLNLVEDVITFVTKECDGDWAGLTRIKGIKHYDAHALFNEVKKLNGEAIGRLSKAKAEKPKSSRPRKGAKA